MWADRGDFLKLPFAKYCIEGVLKQDSSNVMLSIAQSDIGDWGAPLFGHFHAFVPCFIFSPGCEFASQTGRNESCPRPWIHEKMEIMNVDKVVSMTTYPQLVGDTRLPNTDLTNCWPPTANYGRRVGNEIFWCPFLCLYQQRIWPT